MLESRRCQNVNILIGPLGASACLQPRGMAPPVQRRWRESSKTFERMVWLMADVS